jgi:hypothetical protein
MICDVLKYIQIRINIKGVALAFARATVLVIRKTKYLEVVLEMWY